MGKYWVWVSLRVSKYTNNDWSETHNHGAITSILFGTSFFQGSEAYISDSEIMLEVNEFFLGQIASFVNETFLF